MPKLGAPRGHSCRQPRQVWYIAVPCVVVLASGMRSGLDIGYRHVLPMVPFLCVLLAGAVALLLLNHATIRKQQLRIAELEQKNQNLQVSLDQMELKMRIARGAVKSPAAVPRPTGPGSTTNRKAETAPAGH